MSIALKYVIGDIHTFLKILVSVFIVSLFSLGLDAQLPDPISCDDSGVPPFNINDCSGGVFIGDDIDTRDNNLNIIATVTQTDVGGATEVLVEDGTEYCDHDGNTGLDTEGPDVFFNIPVTADKRESCEAGVLTITLRGDFNNSCEVAYIVNECGIIIAQSDLTGLPEGDKCDVIFPLQVNIPAADLTEAAADGIITFSVRTNGGTPGFQGSEVDGTCGPGRGVDCLPPFGFEDGNCVALHSFTWPIQNTAEAGSLNSVENIICEGESINIDVLGDLMFDDPIGSGGDADSNPMTGSYHLDFYFGGGPNPANPYPTDGGIAGDVVNVYDASTGSNPQVTIINDDCEGIQDHSNTNAPLTSGGVNLPANTLIEVVGSVWGDSNVEPIGVGSCFGEIVNCGENTNYISFVLLKPITAVASCACAAGTNQGIVTITGFDGGLPAAVAASATSGSPDYILQPTGGTLSSTTTGVGGNVTLTLDPGQTSWSVTVLDGEGCEFHLNGTCGIPGEAEILFPTYICLVNEALDVSVSPAGGTLSGPGVAGTTFNPATAGLGTHTLTYTYTDGNCEVTTDIDITVESADEFDTLINYDDQVVCAGEVVNLSAADDGGIFTGFGVTDNGDGTATFMNTVAGDYVVTYSLSTASGCSISTSAIITVDGNKPVIMVPPSDLFVECDGSGNVAEISNWVALSGGMVAVDDNGDVTLSAVAGTATGTCPEFISYTFTAEDACGNSISEVATVTIIDSTSPTVNPPAATVVDCTTPVDPEGWAQTATTMDNCDSAPLISFALINLQELCSGTTAQTIYTYSFTAIDACGNQSLPLTSTYTIEDPDAPMVLAPADLEVSCEQDISLLVTEWLDDYMLVFNCFDIENPIVNTDYDATAITDACGITIPVTWTVTTACGATASDGANIIISDDTTGPELTCVPEYTFSVDVDDCGANIAIPLPIATDCNGIESVVQTSPIPNIEFPIGTTVVTFTATDDCGNVTTCTTNVVILDTQNPELVCPPSINACNDPGTCAWVSDDSVNPLTSDCGSTLLTYSVGNPDGSTSAPAEIEGYVFEVGSSTVTVTSTDTNGNETICNFTVTVEDCEAPTLICPVDVTVECDSPEEPRFEEVNKIQDEDNRMMDCNCEVSQGDQSFPITTIQTAESAVSFYSYGSPNAASANTGFELVNTTLVFLHEDTNTGDISLVVIMDAPGGGGGRGSLDFFCLPTGATIDLSDDAGEITGVPPTIMTNFGWIDCCTDGTVIGNVGCDMTFDFIPLITSGITDMAWVTGTEDSPIYTSFNNFVDPVRIVCGNGQPACCQNENMVTSTDSSCPNLDDGSIDVTTDPAAAPYTFLWSTGDTTEDLNGVVAGTYLVTITDVDNCEQILEVEVGLTQTCDNSDARDALVGAAMAMDNCDDDIVVTETLINTISGCGNTASYVYEFTATDAAGNIEVCYATYTVEDTTPPALDSEAMDLIVECDGNGNVDALIGWLADNGGAVASDICNPDITWTNDFTTMLSNDCGDTGEIEVTFTATDDCGNFITTTATFMIDDTVVPEIVCPSPIVLQCGDPANDAIIEAWLASASSSDDCNEGMITNTYPDVFASDCGDTGIYTVTFTVEDACGLTADCVSTITIEDTLIPEFTIAPQDLIVECDGAGNSAAITNWLSTNGGGIAADQCDAIVDWTIVEGAPIEGCGGGSEIPYTFTITDDCGNMSVAAASVIIDDSTMPTLTVPADMLVECDGAGNSGALATWLLSASGSDDCSDVVVSSQLFNSISACGGASTMVYQFTATDECGNITQGLAEFVIEDTTPAEITCPDDLALECGDPNNNQLINAWLTSATAADLCTDGCISDACSEGFIVVTPADLGLVDDTDDQSAINVDVSAKFGLPAGSILVSASNVNTNANGTYVLSAGEAPQFTISGCQPVFIRGTHGGGISIGNTDGIVSLDGSSYTLTTTLLPGYSASDTPPAYTVTNDSSTTAQTGGFVWESNTTASAIQFTTTNSGGAYNLRLSPECPTPEELSNKISITTDFDGILPDACMGSVDVTFTATDQCGNTSTCVTAITMNDSADPFFINCPDDLTINTDVDECDGMPIFSIPVALDDCDNQVMVTQTVGPAPGEEFIVGAPIAVQFEAEDDCGNTTLCDFTITVVDSDIPNILCPSNDVVACANIGTCTWVSSGLSPTTIENCDFDVTFSVSGVTTIASGMDDVSGTTFNLGTSIVTYTILDDNGNTSTCSFNVIVEDCEIPEIICPAPMTVECDGAGNTTELAAWLATASATDNCDAVVSPMNNIFNTISGCGGTETFTYEFISIDAAGNENRCLATFTIEDTSNPVIDTDAIDETVECDGNGNTDALIGWLANNGGAVASDICGPNITWTNNYTTLLSNDCGDTGEVEVIFTATDDCGNENTTMATFTIEDTTAPEIVCPTPIVLECSDPANDAIINAWLATATTTDNCNTVSIMNNYPDVFVGECGDTGVYTVTFTATDECGLTSICEATITIEDNLNPEFLLSPQDLIVECDGLGNAGDITNWVSINGNGEGVDGCDAMVDWVAVAGATVIDCGGTSETPYTFTITDDCGNTSTAIASVIIEDTTPPTIVGPDDTTMACNPADNPGQISTLLAAFFATDVCDIAPVVTTELYNSISGCGGTSAETYLITATDACGNTSTRLFTFTIEDTDAPTLEQPDPLMLECGNPDNPSLINAWLDQFTGTDFCGGNVTVTSTWDGELVDGCGVNTLVSFNISDECGNNYDFNSTITINDTVDPYFINCPSDLTINTDVDECDGMPIFSIPVALDDCDNQVTVTQTVGPAPGEEFIVGAPIPVQFTAVDDCMNSVTCDFTITVIDADEPTILCPSNDVVACADDETCTWVSSGLAPTTIENCEYTVTYTVAGATIVASGTDDVSGTIFNLGTSVVTYMILDDNGNMATCSFDVIIEDCESPEITCPPDLTVECDGAGNTDVLAAWLTEVSATDNCDLIVIPTTNIFNTISGCGDTESFTYEFTATDAAGNEDRCLATFTIEDTTMPAIDTDASGLTVECDGNGNTDALLGWLANNGGAIATDVCGPEITWTNNYTTLLSNDCGDTGEVDVIFTATDGCGNENTTQATFTIEDTVPPVIICPDNIALECSDPANAAIIEAWLAIPTSSDDCNTVVITHNYPDVFVPACGMTGVFTVTFTATDACDLVSTCDATITIEDTTAPEITVEPMDLFVDCAGDVAGALADWLAMNGGAMGEDLCDDAPVWSNAAAIAIPACGTTTSTIYTFTLTDDCGNASSATATFGTTDTTAPVLTPPTDLVVECDGAGNTADLTAWLMTATAVDDCDATSVVTNLLFNTISVCGGGSTEVYEFTAVDDCGNVSQGLAEFTIEDTTVPAIVCPSTLVLECGDPNNDQIVIDWLAAGTATDACSGVDVTADYPGTLPAACMGSVDVTFTATDDCGNVTTCEAMITMDDTEDPYFVNCPTAPLTINVDVDVCGAFPIFSTPVALDDCDVQVLVEQTGGLAPGTEFPVGTTSLEFTATDDCGNTDICTFDIIVVDSDVPNILCPSNTVIACNNAGDCEWTSVDIGPTTSIENCPFDITYEITGELTSSGVDDASGEVFPLGLSEVCYTITDENDNTSMCCFDVLIEDCEDPMITCPTPLTIECDGLGNATDLANWLATVSATDNCDETVTITNRVINTISGCGDSEAFVYQFTAVDLAGNTSTCFETFTIEDTTMPSIDTPAMDMIVECDGIGNTAALLGWLSNNGGAIASDVCSDITWTNDYTTMFTDACAETGAIEVTFTATDACGNLNTTTATFTIEDTVIPEITAPADILLECGENDNDAIIAAWVNDFTVFDVCDVNVTVATTTVVVPDCGNTSVTTYTFTATDACANVNTDSAIVTIEDTTPPVIDPLPLDLVLECNDADNDVAIVEWLDLNGGAMATDDCGSVTWTNEAGAEEMTCGNTTNTPYTFIATDECGNFSTAIASIIIEDTTPPELVAPTNLVEECENIIVEVDDWIAMAASTDLCGTPIITAELWNTISGCGDTFTETYLFTATDECGNTSTALADYGLEDTIAPLIVTEAINMVIECNGSDNVAILLNWLNNNGGAVATDGCGDLTWSNDYGMVAAGACDGEGSITVTFTVSDECDNVSTTTATLTIEDTEAPTFEIPASDLTLECTGDVDPMNVINSWLVNVGGADAEDDCSLITYTNDFVALTNGCSPLTGSALVTFTATDACGNSDETMATVTVVDETPPTITRPATDMTVECDGAGNIAALEAWLLADGNAEADDICSPFTWDEPILVSTIVGCGQTMTFIYEFATTDDCGNESASTIASFIIEDTTSPTILPEAMSMTVECDGMGNEADLAAFLNGQGEAIAVDDCGVVVWEFDLITIEETCALTNIQTYRFTATDECGNVSTSEAIFTIEDTTAPLIVGGADMLMEECEPRGDNYPEFDFWLEDHAGATATDDCSQFTWTNDFDPDNWVFICGFSRFVDVTFTATDECGNADSFTNRFGIGDVTPPEFTFCPPPTIVDAPAGWCSSYVNFTGPLAEDACGETTVTQVDDTGLTTGDLFPVGLTILTYQAEDECGNISECEIKIIVNDFHTPPTISCPIDTMTVNDFGVCGAVIDDIAPFDVTDNCPDNLVVKYEIIQNGNIIADGFDDASGEFFPTGISTVNYQAIDQPLILITEIIQDGVITGVEIANIGPAAVDVSCLNVVREGTSPESYNLANGTCIPVGGVITQTFTNIGVGDPAGYYISLVGRVIDGVSINGYASTTYPFAGNIVGEDIIRVFICDHDFAGDFKVAASCFAGSYGFYNPELDVAADNGTKVGLQEGVPSIVECSFEVTIEDTEVPSCAMYDTLTYMTTLPQNIDGELCTTIDFVVTDDVPVGTVILSDLQVTIADAGALSGYLISPSGTTVQIFGGMCSGTADVDVTFDQNATDNLSTVLCDPLGNGLVYEPLESFKSYFNESSLGTWTLSLEKTSPGIAILDNVEFQVLTHLPYAQTDVKLDNDLEMCGAEYIWDHPVFWDNCCEGGISVEYSSEDDIVVPINGDVIGGSTATEFFAVGTTLIVYTLVDQFGNESQCSFEVEVCDVEAPVLSACPDVTLFLLEDDCLVPISSVPVPTFTDQCPGATFVFDPPLEDGLTEGVQDICVIVTDASGNESKCTFTVTVLPNPNEEPDGALACNSAINLSLGADCMEFVTADMILEGDGYGCLDDFCVTLKAEDHETIIGTSADGTNIVTEDHIGQTLIVEICENCEDGVNCCWGYVNIENKLIPEVVCPPDTIIECNMAFDPEITGMPEVTTCEQEIYITYEDDYIEQTMCNDPVATIERTWTIIDESNNQISCVQMITITDFDLETVVYPDDIILTETYTCSEIEDDPTLLHPEHTGYPLLGGIPVYETGDGLCSHFWNWDDQILFNCEGSYEIIRTWLIRDMCDPIIPFVNPIEHYQSIKVLDSSPPVFDHCPETVSINASAHDCLGDIYLNDYFPGINDACGTVKDTVITVTPGTVYQSPPNSGEYYIRDLTTGVHTVKIKAKDQCSNFAVCEFDIQVTDNSAPTVICDFDVVVGLNTLGTAKIFPESIDEGSHDACTDIFRQLYRVDSDCLNGDDLVPGDDVTFCCEDVANSPVMVVMRVWDDADLDGVFGTAGDNYNECMVPVTVQDKTIPNFQCPFDVILTCDEDYTNLAITGQPAISSVCTHLDATYEDDITDLDACNLGEITRTWTVTETGQTCVQTITLQSPDVVSEMDIVWPADLDVDFECNIDNLSPQDLPLANAYPGVVDGQCSLLGMNHTDEIFEVASGQTGCYKILRTWQILNWCVESDDGHEIYEHVQTIKVLNDVAPELIAGCDDMTIETTSQDCAGGQVVFQATATDDCTVETDFEWSYIVDYQADGNIDLEGTTDIVDEMMPVGTHQITWTVSDQCNNTDVCSALITVIDSTPPSPKCKSGLVLPLTANVAEGTETAELWAIDIDAGSDHPCGSSYTFTFSFSEDPDDDVMFFDCDDIGTQTVQLWLTDLNGNQAFCETSVIIQDNNDVAICEPSETLMATISGRIATELEVEVDLVEVSLVNGAQVEVTNDEGQFAFTEMPMGGAYIVEPFLDIDDRRGVSTLDIILIQRHILNLQPLASPYDLIAADANSSQSVTSADMVDIRKVILEIVDKFPANTSWRFIDKTHTFIDATNPWLPAPDESYQIPFLVQDMVTDFIAVKVGDVNGSYTSLAHSGDIDIRGIETQVLEYEEIEEGVFNISAESEDMLYGLQVSIEVGPGFTELTSDLPGFSTDNYTYDGQHVRISYNHIHGIANDQLTKLFQIKLAGQTQLIVSNEIANESYHGTELEVKRLSLEPLSGIAIDAIDISNHPNPWKQSTKISIVSPEETVGELTFYNNLGEVIYRQDVELEIGDNTIRITKRQLQTAGVIRYVLDIDGTQWNKSMIVIE